MEMEKLTTTEKAERKIETERERQQRLSLCK